jgi:hypothetical protein
MATAAAPRSYVYLSLLAGRAITALADLAEDPKVWGDQIRKGLEDGIEYCRVIGEDCASTPVATRRSGAPRSFKRLATHDNKELSATCAASESREIKRLLMQLLSKSRKPKTSELVVAIEFLTKNAIDEGAL